MLYELCRFVFISLVLTPSTIDAISLDYYFGDSLRTDLSLNCSSEELRKSCEMKCGPNHACLLGKCFCIQNEKEPLDEGSEEVNEFYSGHDDTFSDFQDYTEMTPKIRNQVPITVYEPKPALRHHIAHFCPTLEIARECIRTCMEVGKPAFCGKDHVCYCGHKYSNSVDNKKNLDPADAYAEFKDMYQKYFGPRDMAD